MENLIAEKTVRVYCDGCFDLTHYGHANSFRQAKEMGDALVVGVHTTADIEKFKGPTVLEEEERYALVRAMKWVDEVVEGATCWPTSQTLFHLRSDFITHGDDLCIASNDQDPYDVLRKAGKLKTYERTPGISTSGIIERILSEEQDVHVTDDSFLEKLKSDMGKSTTYNPSSTKTKIAGMESESEERIHRRSPESERREERRRKESREKKRKEQEKEMKA